MLVLTFIPCTCDEDNNGLPISLTSLQTLYQWSLWLAIPYFLPTMHDNYMGQESRVQHSRVNQTTQEGGLAQLLNIILTPSKI